MTGWHGADHRARVLLHRLSDRQSAGRPGAQQVGRPEVVASDAFFYGGNFFTKYLYIHFNIPIFS